MRVFTGRRRLVVLGVLAIAGMSTFLSVRDQTERKPAPSETVASEDLSTPDGAIKDRLVRDYGKLPLHFEENQGQTDAQVQFLARGRGYGLFLTGTEAVLSLRRASDTEENTPVSDVVKVRLIGSNPTPEVSGQDLLPGKSNYLIGDRTKWRTDIPHYGKVKYRDIYPGIDLVYYGTDQRMLEYDFIVNPGIDPDMIRFKFEGMESLDIDEKGNLILDIPGGEVVLKAPITYQEMKGVRQDVSSHYVLHSKDQVGFQLVAYDQSRPLVIDPVLSYSTYLGGSGEDLGLGIAGDSAGNAYVTGRTKSTDFPTQIAAQATITGTQDAFVSKLNASGTVLIYSTYLGGSGTDSGESIAVDGSGNAYITGYTNSSDFPTQNSLQGAYGGGTGDVFVTKLNTSGSLIFSTYLGGSDLESGRSITVDGSGNAYLMGDTGSSDFPTQNPFQGTVGGVDAFVAKLNASGSTLLYSTYLGGSGIEDGKGIAVDGSGNIYVTGETRSSNFPTQNSFQSTIGADLFDGFIAKLNSSGTTLVYSTYLGGSGLDDGRGIAVDGSGNAYITGRTTSLDFPTQNPFQGVYGGSGSDAFVAKLNASGSVLYSTYLGGSANDVGGSIEVDSAGGAYVAGYTASTDFPTQNPFQGARAGGFDLFVTELDASGSALIYSTYLGGSGLDVSGVIALDDSGNVYITAGEIQSADFPTQNPLQGTYGGNDDAIVAKLVPSQPPVAVSIPDTFGVPGTTVQVPVYIGDATGLGVVAVELLVAYDRTIVTPGSPNRVNFGALTATGWSIEDNVFPDGVGTTDTLSIALSTASDTLSGSGELAKLVLDVAGISPPASTPLELVSVLFNDGDPVAVTTDGSLTLATNAVLTAEPDSIIPRLPITVTVDDADRNLNGAVIDSVLILAFDKVYSDSQYAYILEQAVNAGIFVGTISTEFDATGGTSFDGVIGTIAGDSICVTYADSFNVSGSPIVLADTVEVVGGADGVAVVSYVVQSLDGRDGVRDTVRVRVTEADLNVDALVVDSVVVEVTHTKVSATESDSVVVYETGINTGVFEVRLPTVEGSPGTDNDDILTITGFDTLIVAYDDTLTALGGTNAAKDSARVINLFGDARSNDLIQAFDAAYILATAVGLTTTTATDTLVQDVDGSNDILAADASQVLQYVVRLIDRFPVQTDFIADPKNHPFEKPVPIDRIIALGDFQMQTDGTYLAPIRLGEREGILSGTLRIGFDAGVEVLGVTTDPAYSGFMVAHNAGEDGVRIAFAGSRSEAEGPGEVLYLKLKPVGDVPLRLSLDQVYLNGRNLTPEFAPEVTAAAAPEDRPLVYALHQNAPNPFNPETTIGYELPEAAQVRLVVYNLLGQEVRTLVSAQQEAGRYQVTWDGQDAQGYQVGSGVYILRMDAGSFLQTRRMLLLK